jgi:hypothetical protein
MAEKIQKSGKQKKVGKSLKEKRAAKEAKRNERSTIHKSE